MVAGTAVVAISLQRPTAGALREVDTPLAHI
jgi:hypothetical protein